MRRFVSGLVMAAGLVTSSLAVAAPWSFDPEQYLASLSDEERCTTGAKPEMTGSVTPRPPAPSIRKHTVADKR